MDMVGWKYCKHCSQCRPSTGLPLLWYNFPFFFSKITSWCSARKCWEYRSILWKMYPHFLHCLFVRSTFLRNSGHFSKWVVRYSCSRIPQKLQKNNFLEVGLLFSNTISGWFSMKWEANFFSFSMISSQCKHFLSLTSTCFFKAWHRSSEICVDIPIVFLNFFKQK